jgi:hypothetical protein
VSRVSKNLARSGLAQKQMIKGARCFSDNRNLRTINEDSKLQPKESFMQFSKEPIMNNFGELKFGEIPEPLKYARPFHSTELSNGIRVCTENVAGQTAHVAVYVGAGSRHEDLATTGTSYLLQQMLARGTNNRSKNDLNDEISQMGARYAGHSDREFTRLGL